MKSIVIFTHSKEELIFLNPLEVGMWNCKRNSETSSQIIGIYFNDRVFPEGLVNVLNSCNYETILLFHGTNFNKAIHDKLKTIKIQFKCSSASGEDRKQYDLLRMQQMDVFDQVWSYFHEKSKGTVPIDLKLELLTQIYGGKPMADIALDKGLTKFLDAFNLLKDTIVTRYENDKHAEALIEFRDKILADI